MKTLTFLSLIVRIIELAVVTFGSYWLWNSIASPFNLWIVFAVLVTYVFYLGVTGTNDYIVMKKGEGEDRM